ncbi:E3 ubiquitin-protein ligase RNF34 [Linepithema humile]|uniref:E3 ubiquitin-protein ligase RNF34 n=1 Tax=Linepithema humile TaxID=83485 RepID=UPI0006235603|nr:PREDICTED: E3 ubiquitin-protein ligase RNF34 isoform X2 [Linepithema humile]
MSPSRHACRRGNGSRTSSNEMACEACSAKFNLFKRKKQCMDCLRYFCSECVIKRMDKIFTCESCGVLSRRPLVKNQIRQMRSKDIRQYLVAKKVSVKGCIEKEDLVHILMSFANGADPCLCADPSINHNIRLQNVQEPVVFRVESSLNRSESMPNVSINNAPHENAQAEPQPTRSEDVEMEDDLVVEVGSSSRSTASSPIVSIPPSDNESPEDRSTRSNHVEIEEVLDSNPADSSNAVQAEPVVTEQEEVSETSNEKKSDMVTEIPTWSDKVHLSDIKEASELEYLNIKQLKNLLSTNRVDYKGCIERQELLNRVSRLWQEYKQSRQDVEKLSEEELCKICWDAPIECVILECGHMACCINCGKQMSECPICKQYVIRVVRFFKA